MQPRPDRRSNGTHIVSSSSYSKCRLGSLPSNSASFLHLRTYPPQFLSHPPPKSPFPRAYWTMSDGPRDGWSTSPANAPKVLHFALALERHVFAVIFICSILYGTRTPSPMHRPIHPHFIRLFILGTLVVLFFQCMTPLLDPVHRRGEGIKWGLVSYTVTTFSFATVYATNLNIQSISLINNREFSGGPLFGPTPYTTIMITPTVLGLTPNIMFALNNWLADGLLVSPSFDAALTWLPRRLTTAPSLALSLLHNLLHEPLGHRPPLSHVPCPYWYAFEFSANRRRCSGLMSQI